jgi:hypothetical protein
MLSHLAPAFFIMENRDFEGDLLYEGSLRCRFL